MAKRRNDRQDAIRRIVRDKEVRTQRTLVDELKAYGYECTQATVSRDISEMGLQKLPGGVYVLGEDLRLQRVVSELVSDVLRAGNLIVVKTLPGTASSVAAIIDAAGLPGVLGVLADNGTVLVVTRDEDEGVRLEGPINKFRSDA